MDPILLTAILSAAGVIFAAIILGWAAEASERYIAPGLALAILALLQTLPEYTVEAVIAWSRNTHLMVANLTGSLRLLLGFGWPMIFFIAVVSGMIKKRPLLKCLELNGHQSLETLFLVPPVIYFTFIWYKGTMTPVDGFVLVLMFFAYIMAISKARVSKEEVLDEDELPFVVRKVTALSRKGRIITISGMFVVGGIVILLIAHPFVESLKALAVSLGISQFLFIQWIAPFVSEFPEKTTAFMWAARMKKATTGMMNMVSSNLNQWTLLAGTLPWIFSLSSRSYSTIIFDDHQREEILLTILQTAMVVVCMWDGKITWWKSFLIFILWVLGFFMPSERHHLVYAHLISLVVIFVAYLFIQPVPLVWKKALSSVSVRKAP